MSNWHKYCDPSSWHEAANLFPMMSEEEKAELVSDIKQYGLYTPVVLHEDKVLDGRNRVLACREACVEPRFVNWTPSPKCDSPTLWVVSLNVKRRNLSATQKAVIAHEMLPILEREAKERMRLSEGRGKKKEQIVEDEPQEKGTQKVEYLNQTCSNSDVRNEGLASHQAAVVYGVNRQYVSDVKRIAEKAPELIPQMKAGTVSMSEALVSRCG
jgi:hypothetical protein